MTYKITNGVSSIEVSDDEIWILIQALNEVCNGLIIPETEFHSRFGFRKATCVNTLSKLSEFRKQNLGPEPAMKDG